VSSLEARRNVVAAHTAGIAMRDRPRIAFLEWLLPPFNGGHWNPEIVEIAGGIDVLGAAGRASGTLSWEQIVASRPDVLFIACCGFDIARALTDVGELSHTDAWHSLRAATRERVFVADGNAYFSSPGPRLIDGLEIMAHALHPLIHPRGPGLAHIVQSDVLTRP
jgi:iron complex transport system substrate-binding protein